VSAAYCRFAPSHPVHGPYHDAEYGFPSTDERVLFEAIARDQPSGIVVVDDLNKRAAFRAAYADFDVDRVAAFGPSEIEGLLVNPGIVRNRLKIAAAVENAGRVQGLRASHGSFALRLDAHHPRSIGDWTRLFRNTFRFSGGQIVGEFLLSLGHLPGGRMSLIARLLRGSPNCRRPGRAPARHWPCEMVKGDLTAPAVSC
jgi:DNA-3-methyladenine glycosylase I